MRNNNLKRKLANIFKKNISFTLLMFIGMLIITVVPAIVAIPVDYLIGKQEIKEILFIRFNDILEVWKKYCRLFIITIIADILIIIGRLKPLKTVDFINNKIMYRDIIQKNSVIGLAYIDNFKEDFYKYVTITLLSLQLKGRIQLNGNKIAVINLEDQYNLRESEQYILNNIKKGRIIIKELKEIRFFENLAKKEAIKDNLVKDNKDMKKNSLKTDKNKIILFFVFLAILFLSGLVLGTLFPKWTEEHYLGIAIALFLFGTMYMAISICVRGIINVIAAEKSERTNLGEEINIKLEGLRNYIKDYSLLHEREKQELELWKEYLIYSVMFNQNKKIVEDIKELIIFE